MMHIENRSARDPLQHSPEPVKHGSEAEADAESHEPR